MSWESKVQRVIGKLSYVAWDAANHDASGRRYKRHRPYRMPAEADELVKILGMQDRRVAERKAKEIMEGLRRAGLEID